MRYLPPDILNKIKKLNQTMYENAQPQMVVDVYKAGTSVAALDMWYVETIREKASGLGDIAVALKRTNPNAAPTVAYEIHVDGGIVKTATKSLINFSKSKWVDAFTVEAGSAVSIEFNGYWVQDSKKRYNLITEELPYLFWVDSNGNLQCQKWDDASTRVQLATGISKVAAIRGWKNTIENVDQGLICAYIKTDGTLWYRTYATQNDETVIWEAERQVIQFASVTNVELFRTNDFRLGFAIESGGTVSWLLTKRAWAGMSVGAENISAAINATVDFTQIQHLDAFIPDEYLSAGISSEVQFCPNITIQGTAVRKVDLYTVAIDFDYPIINPIGQEAAFTVNNYTVVSTALGDNPKTLLITTSGPMTSFTNFPVTYDPALGNLRCTVNDYCKMYVSAFSLTIPGAPPQIDEHLTASISATAILTYINKSQGYEPNEHLTALISAIVQLKDVNGNIV